eukprot:TRINITY_DN4117_c0_g1_i3.p1 TRINITY_DN4117_c0_g1~~TRINITY_DN4117_c0_g1_i3.p1  ORF type:complete len:1426 (-),score=248.93 TRINITY_DN4117_c0_g1_i3:235-4512(-)
MLMAPSARSVLMYVCGIIFLVGSRAERTDDEISDVFQTEGTFWARQVSASDWITSRKGVLHIAEAEGVFKNWRAQLENANCRNCGKQQTSVSSAGLTPEMPESLLEEETQDVEEIMQSSGPPTRVLKALAHASMPQPALASCLSMALDLSALGIPGVTLRLAIRGEVAYTLCTRCFSWKADADFAFEWGFAVLGAPLKFGFHVAGSLDLKELPCEDAAGSHFCRFLNVVLPPEAQHLASTRSRCHSDSPFESLTAFIKYQWQRLRTQTRGDGQVWANDLEKELHAFSDKMKIYPLLFQDPIRATKSSRILLATCIKGTDLLVRDVLDANDPFCQLEVALADSTLEENYKRVYGGTGPKKLGDCTFDVRTRQCHNLDRCLYKPSMYKRRLCRLVPEFMGELWRSSILLDTPTPIWKESHGFKLPDGSNDIKMHAWVYDFDAHKGSATIGQNFTARVTVGPEPLTLSLGLKRQDGRQGELLVKLEWLKPEKGEEPGALEGPLQAMVAALLGFTGKLPDYADELLDRFNAASAEYDEGVDYSSISGRYLARWRLASARENLQQKELDEMSEAIQDEVDPHAPLTPEGCKWSRESKQCEPSLYCTSQGQTCKLKEIAEKPCHDVPAGEFCCGTSCTGHSSKKQCQNVSMVCLAPSSFFESAKRCACSPGKCYDEVEQTCKVVPLDCTRGNPQQQRNCEKEKLFRRFKQRQQAAGDSTHSFSIWHMRLQDLEARFEARPCSSIQIRSDERVLNFQRTFQSASARQKPEDRSSVFTELVISATNLFVRSVADVQAMFNIYFANAAAWDDDCLTLVPSFSNFFEFEDDGEVSHLGTQWRPSSYQLTHRVRGKVSEPAAEPMADEENPWCAYTFASVERQQSGRIHFARRDPPLQADLFVSPRELNGTMMPHLWCELARKLRSTPEGRNRSFGEKRYEEGWAVGFEAACSQLAFTATGGEGRFHIWRRYDCEKVVLGSAFLTIFPSFAAKVQETHSALGRLLEDALQCAGQLSQGNRQFKPHDPYVTESCAVDIESMLKRENEEDAAKQRRAEFLAVTASAALSTLQRWLKEISDMGTMLRMDFEAVFGRGHKLSGLAFTADAGKGFQQVKDMLGRDDAIQQRSETVQAHLVQKAWRTRGQLQKSLFPPPVHYTGALEGGIVVGRAKDICSVEMAQGVRFDIVNQRSGVTFAPTLVQEERLCASGSFAPLKSLEISIIACTRAIDIDGKSEAETSFAFRFKSILSVEDLGKKLQIKMGEIFTQGSKLGTSELAKDKVTSSPAWLLAKSLLKDPTAILSEALAASSEHLKEQVNSIGHKISKLSSKFVGAAVGIDSFLSLKDYHLLDVQLGLTKVGDAPYYPTFQVEFKKVTAAGLGVGMPGLLNMKITAHVSQAYDLSEVFSELYHLLVDKQDQKEPSPFPDTFLEHRSRLQS